MISAFPASDGMIAANIEARADIVMLHGQLEALSLNCQ
jgi:hypothetical protein